MSKTNRVIEGKNERQKMIDKLSMESGQAYTYDQNREERTEHKNSGCLSYVESARKKVQELFDG